MKVFSRDFNINKKRINEDVITLNVATQSQQGTEVQTTQETQPTDTQNTQDQSSNNVQEVKAEGSPVKFFSKLFESREMAHVYHLQVRGDQGSHAAHVALGEYYEGVLDLVDELVEVYQGQYDIVEGYDIIDTNVTKDLDRLEYFKNTVEQIKKSRYVSLKEEDAHLQAIVDEVINLMYKLIYKLRFNK